MTNLAPVTLVLLVMAATFSFVGDNVLYGAPFFILALANELARMIVIARGAPDESDRP